MKSDIPGITGKGDMSDKPHMRALNPKFLLEIGRVFRFGQKKHGMDNFRLMTPEAAGELIDASMRHLLAYIGGEESASDSGLSHLAHLVANINMLYRIQSRGSYEEVIKIISGGDL